ncbi:hypothetical protein NLX71_26045 [Paenibacillus sp. MZ04-78.2]|uniref:hypothetical protein n=1 Tax=Paenibacillus sp. MZ04-78.2 TaxID=2962034 RepID=UPI0020B6DDC9|nr:hypothetical protein [Paenibacillus sp. MZ04-78.2]MCP3776704.1 hypothetical protein [Paenibacillus sp. MZ04-78.2]
MQDISLWCPKCEMYTKKYSAVGQCMRCETEVITGGYSRVDIDFEGYIEVLKNGSLKLIESK